MKVTTDACIQGAWTPVPPYAKRALDIGTGTGLLALMLAQRAKDMVIDAIEYDHEAAAQAKENFAASPWSERLRVIEGDVCEHKFANKYDLIISNPPFFNNSLLGDDDDKNMARHTVSLSYESLLKVIGENLSETGYASVLLPYPEYLLWKELLMKGNWVELGKLSVSHRPGATVKRVVCLFSKAKVMPLQEGALVIQNEQNQYTAEFSELLGPFYLNL